MKVLKLKSLVVFMSLEHPCMNPGELIISSVVEQGRQGDIGSTRFMVSLQDEMFQKFNFDTEWAVKLISRITNNSDQTGLPWGLSDPCLWSPQSSEQLHHSHRGSNCSEAPTKLQRRACSTPLLPQHLFQNE